MDFFPPVDFPVVEHIPWVKKNIPIPPGLFEEVCRIVHTKFQLILSLTLVLCTQERWKITLPSPQP
jgi:hypothetical protein